MSLQMILPRTSDVGQMQHNLNQQPLQQHEFAVKQEEQSIRNQQETVRTKDQPEDGKVRDEGRGQGGSYYRQQQRREPNPDDEPKMAVDASRGHFIDISL